METLDVAAQRPVLGISGTVLRRMMACNAAMHYFGERSGGPVRHPALVLRHLVTTLGGTTEAYLERYRATLARALAEFDRARSGDGDMRMVSAARSWMDNSRMALSLMCREVAPRLPEGPTRDEAAAWCAVVPRIDAIREAAAASQRRHRSGR